VDRTVLTDPDRVLEQQLSALVGCGGLPELALRIRAAIKTGFLRYSISDLVLSTKQLEAITAFLSGVGHRLRHLQKAHEELLVRATRLPAYIFGREGEAMPVLSACRRIAA
jgi:hypothetical protein